MPTSLEDWNDIQTNLCSQTCGACGFSIKNETDLEIITLNKGLRVGDIKPMQTSPEDLPYLKNKPVFTNLCSLWILH